MIGDLYDASGVVVGQAAVLFNVEDTALPNLDSFNTSDPFDLTFWTTAPAWTPCGATDQGWQFGANKNTQVINIEEQSTPVATTITSQSVSITGSMAEDVTKTLTLALNATSAATAAVVGASPGYDTIQLSDEPIKYAVALVTTNKEGFGRIIYAPSWTQLSNATTNFRRASEKRMYPVQFETVCATDLIKVINFTATK